MSNLYGVLPNKVPTLAEPSEFQNFTDVMKLDFGVPKGYSTLHQYSEDWGYGNRLGTLHKTPTKPTLTKQTSFLTEEWNDYFKMGHVPIKPLSNNEYSTGGTEFKDESGVRAPVSEVGSPAQQIDMEKATETPAHLKEQNPRGVDSHAKELEAGLIALGGSPLKKQEEEEDGWEGWSGDEETAAPSKREPPIFTSPKKEVGGGQEFEKGVPFLMGAKPRLVGSYEIRQGQFKGLVVPVFQNKDQNFRVEGNSAGQFEFIKVLTFEKGYIPDDKMFGGREVGVYKHNHAEKVYKLKNGTFYMIDGIVPRPLKPIDIHSPYGEE